VVVLLHGGFWRDRYGCDLMEPLARDLASRGTAAWNVEFRRLGGGGGWPTTLEDVAAGIDALVDLESAGVPLDLTAVACVGHSAGGHLALWAAARPGLPPGAPGAAPRVRIARAVGQAAVSDLADAARTCLSERAAERLLGGSPDHVPGRYALASPFERLPLGVPQLLVHGEADATVPVGMSRRYHLAAGAAGDRCELRSLPDVDHLEHLDPGSAAWRCVLEWLGSG
jgi:acetyl esterase/lipase